MVGRKRPKRGSSRSSPAALDTDSSRAAERQEQDAWQPEAQAVMTLSRYDHPDDLPYERPTLTPATLGVTNATLDAADAGGGGALQEVDRCHAVGTEALEKLALWCAQRRVELSFPAAWQALVASRPRHCGEKLGDGRVVLGHDALLCSGGGRRRPNEETGQETDEDAHLPYRPEGSMAAYSGATTKLCAQPLMV
jgi:hypothetical protein